MPDFTVVPHLVRPLAARVEVGPAAWRRLPGAEYGDAYRVTAPRRVTALEWARLALESAPDALNTVFAALVWHRLLGFDLAPADVPQVASATIVEDEPDLVTLRIDGARMIGRLVFEVDQTSATFSTVAGFPRPAGRRIWTVVGHAHRTLAPRLLDVAARSLAAPADSAVRASTATSSTRSANRP